VAGRKSIVIYGLFCPITHELRYIGKTNKPALRLWQHINEAKTTTATYHRVTWVRSLLRSGVEPLFKPMLQLAGSDMQWPVFERMLITSARYLGIRLVNSTVGGEGSVGPSAEYAAKISRSQTARWAKPEVRQMYLERSQNPEVLARRSVSCAASRNTPESKLLASEHSKQLWNRPEYKVRKSANSKAAWENGDRQMRAQGIASGQKATWSDPVKSAKRRAALTSDEFRAKMVAVNKANWEKRRKNAT
jgi:hypothetical protein